MVIIMVINTEATVINTGGLIRYFWSLSPMSPNNVVIEYQGLWRDNSSRTFPPCKALPGCQSAEGGKFYWSRDVASSVKQLAARIRAEGYTVGYLGLQYPCDAGVAVFESVGPGEHYKRLGAGGVSGTPTSVQVAGFVGKIVEQGAHAGTAGPCPLSCMRTSQHHTARRPVGAGGGWTNAVYKITISEAAPSKSALEAAFRQFDANGDGVLTAAELKAILTRSVSGKPAMMTAKEVDDLIVEFDVPIRMVSSTWTSSAMRWRAFRPCGRLSPLRRLPLARVTRGSRRRWRSPIHNRSKAACRACSSTVAAQSPRLKTEPSR